MICLTTCCAQLQGVPSKHALKQALFAARLVAGAAADGVAAEDAAGVKLRMARRFRALRALRGRVWRLRFFCKLSKCCYIASSIWALLKRPYRCLKLSEVSVQLVLIRPDSSTCFGKNQKLCPRSRACAGRVGQEDFCKHFLNGGSWRRKAQGRCLKPA